MYMEDMDSKLCADFNFAYAFKITQFANLKDLYYVSVAQYSDNEYNKCA